MRRIVYYVASSLDGFISGLNDDISGFVASGNGVDKYLSDLANFDISTVYNQDNLPILIWNITFFLTI